MISGTDRDAASNNALWDIRREFDRVAEFVREQEAIFVVHPSNDSPELRAEVAKTPHAELRVSKYVSAEQVLVIHPGLLGDLTEPKS